MTEDRQAQLLADWLDAEPGTPAPADLDRDVVDAVIALRPERAPALSIGIDDVLGEVRSGPFAPQGDAGDGGDPADGAGPATGAGVVSLAAERRRRMPRWLAPAVGGLAVAALALIVVTPIADKAREPYPAAPPPARRAPVAQEADKSLPELEGAVAPAQASEAQLARGMTRERAEAPETEGGMDAASSAAGMGAAGSAAGMDAADYDNTYRDADTPRRAADAAEPPASAPPTSTATGSVSDLRAGANAQVADEATSSDAVPEALEDLGGVAAERSVSANAVVAEVTVKKDRGRRDARQEAAKSAPAAPAMAEPPTMAEAEAWREQKVQETLADLASARMDGAKSREDALAELAATASGDVARDAAWQLAVLRRDRGDRAGALAVARATLARVGAEGPYGTRLAALEAELRG